MLVVQYSEKTKTWKIGGKMLQFISDFIRESTLNVAVDSTLSDERRIENEVVQGAVPSHVQPKKISNDPK
jgi:hypothetical protein